MGCSGLYSYGAKGGLAAGLGQNEAVCGKVLMSHLPHGVGGITGAVLVTDEAIKARGAESLLAIRAFEASLTQTSSVDVVTLGSVLTLTLLVALRTKAAHRTVVLTPGGGITPLIKIDVSKTSGVSRQTRVRNGSLK